MDQAPSWAGSGFSSVSSRPRLSSQRPQGERAGPLEAGPRPQFFFVHSFIHSFPCHVCPWYPFWTAINSFPPREARPSPLPWHLFAHVTLLLLHWPIGCFFRKTLDLYFCWCLFIYLLTYFSNLEPSCPRCLHGQQLLTLPVLQVPSPP